MSASRKTPPQAERSYAGPMLLKPILRKLLKHPRSIAVVDDQRSFSHIAIAVAAAHVSKEILKRTDKPRVGIMLPTGGGFPIALLACWMAGKVPVPLNYLLERDDMHHVFDDAGVDLLLTAGKLLDHVREHTSADAIPESLDLLTLETMNFKGVPPVLPLLRGAIFGTGRARSSARTTPACCSTPPAPAASPRASCSPTATCTTT